MFADIEDRLPPDVQARLAQLMPSDEASKEARQLAFSEMQAYFMKNRHEIFTPFSTSFCLVHGKECRTCSPPNDLDNDRYPHPLVIHSAGTTCLGWSSAGKQERHSHVSESTLSIWLAERRALAERDAEHIAFQECVVGFPTTEKVREPLFETHSVVTVKTGPELQGWPTTRPRRFCAAINRRRLFLLALLCIRASGRDLLSQLTAIPAIPIQVCKFLWIGCQRSSTTLGLWMLGSPEPSLEPANLYRPPTF